MLAILSRIWPSAWCKAATDQTLIAFAPKSKLSRRGFLGSLTGLVAASVACPPQLKALATPPLPPVPALTPLQSAMSAFFDAVIKARTVGPKVTFEPRKVFTSDGQFSVSHTDFVTGWGTKKRIKAIGIAQDNLTGLLQQDPHNREFKATLKNLTAENSKLLAQAPYPSLVDICRATFGESVTRIAQDALLQLAQEHVTAVQNRATLAVSESLPKRLIRVLGESGASEEVQLAAKLLAHNFHFNVTEKTTKRGKDVQKLVPYGLTIRMITDNSTINGMDYTSRGTGVPYLVLSNPAVEIRDYSAIR